MPALYVPPVDVTGSSSLQVSTIPLAVTCPGNMPPHFRVQTRSSGVNSPWKLVASFSELALAQICLDRLRCQGESARLIPYRRVPTAA